MSATAAAEHTCHGAIFCGQPRAAAEHECPACQAARPLQEVLDEHCARARARRDVERENAARSAELQQNAAVDRRVAELRACNCGGHQTRTHLPACPAAATEEN